ncbi:hypothetical protein ACWD26_40150 [Streptomyces sp. NPDC002787]
MRTSLRAGPVPLRAGPVGAPACGGLVVAMAVDTPVGCERPARNRPALVVAESYGPSAAHDAWSAAAARWIEPLPPRSPRSPPTLTSASAVSAARLTRPARPPGAHEPSDD